MRRSHEFSRYETPSETCTASRRPVYTIHDVTDRNGRLVHYERLLLRYTLDAQNIDRILASFEFVCEDGAFDGRALMKSPAAPAALKLSATIELLALA